MSVHQEGQASEWLASGTLSVSWSPVKKLSLLVCILILSACSGHEGSQADSKAVANASTAAVNANQPVSLPSSTKPAAPPCPHTGKWAPCSVERRLKQSGFVVKRLTDEAPR